MPIKKTTSGFTLLEILLVIGIISILAGIVIVAINPGRQLATVRNTERRSDLRAIESAMTQYYVDNFHYPTSTPTDLTEICDTGSLPYPSGVDCGSLIDLSALVPLYLTAIPVDPSGASSTLSLIPKAYAATGGTGYEVMKDTNGYIVLSAPEAELGTSIAIGTSTGGGGGGGLGISGLVAHYKMNSDSSGTNVVDTKGHNGTANHTIVLEDHTGMGKALSFSYADDDNVDIGTSDVFNITGPMSVSVWVKFNNTSDQWSAILNRGTSEQYTYAILNSTGIAYYNPNNAWDYGTGGFTYGSWQHIVYSSDGTYLTVYDNGSKVYGPDYVGSPSSESSQDLTIGMGEFWPAAAPDGLMDDFRIYNKALTGPSTNCTDDPGSEVCQLWNGGAGTEAE